MVSIFVKDRAIHISFLLPLASLFSEGCAEGNTEMLGMHHVIPFWFERKLILITFRLLLLVPLLVLLLDILGYSRHYKLI